MRCDTCHGLGHFYRDPTGAEEWPHYEIIPCPDCGGHGVTHCCEGERACGGESETTEGKERQ